MSEITQPPPDVTTQDTSSRVSRLSAASDQSSSNKQSAEQNPGQPAAEVEPEKQVSHHDPAVTLASTLAKLDSGSHFEATVSGHDADGRTIITSELGTYLVETDKSQLDKFHAEEFKKLQKEELVDIRVLTIDKEIKAEILKQTETDTRPTIIPVTLTLTELGHHPETNQVTPPASSTPQAPIDDIKSQYQATTLYKAERIAREIGEKLDNLPLPTTSPNYTVYGAPQNSEGKVTPSPSQQVSQNVFIQEVRTAVNNPSPISVQETNLNQLLGHNIDVQVLKTVPQTPTPVLSGLPDAVLKEINVTTPLDHVTKGQNLNIKIAAIAIPDERSGVPPATTPEAQSTKPSTANTITSNTATPPVSNTAAVTQTPDAKQVPQKAATTTVTPAIGQPDTPIISGIIIDPAQASGSTDPKNTSNTPPAAPTPYSQKSTTQVFNAPGTQTDNAGKTYYLATPTSVLKLQSPTPLTAGTIVNFSVEIESQPASIQEIKDRAVSQPINPEQRQTKAATPSSPITTENSSVAQTDTSGSSQNNQNTISPTFADRIDQFFPQPLESLNLDWASISLAMSALTSTVSSAMAAAMSSRIPNMLNPEQITSTIFFFLSAIKSVTPAKTWLGPDVSAKLKQLGAGRVLERMDHDFTRIIRLNSEAPIGEWRPLLIPFQSGGDITAVPMITKQIVEEDDKQGDQRNEEEGDQKVNDTRFILEINFSQFGKVLIDGLLKEDRLDIILKASDAIPFAIKAKLSRRFQDALDNSGFLGELVIIDETEIDLSVIKMVETMTHKMNVEKKI